MHRKQARLSLRGVLGINGLLNLGLFLSMVNCFFMVIITILDVVSRHLLHRAIPGVIELNEVLMVGIVFLGLAMAQKEKTHIRAELLVSRLSAKWQKGLDIFAIVLSLAFWGILLASSAPRAWQSFVIGEYREGLIKFPIWPARGALCFGLLIMCLQLLYDLGMSFSKVAQSLKEPPAAETIDD